MFNVNTLVVVVSIVILCSVQPTHAEEESISHVQPTHAEEESISHVRKVAKGSAIEDESVQQGMLQSNLPKKTLDEILKVIKQTQEEMAHLSSSMRKQMHDVNVTMENMEKENKDLRNQVKQVQHCLRREPRLISHCISSVFWEYVQYIGAQIKVKRENAIATLTVEKQFQVSFYFKASSILYGNVIGFDMGTGYFGDGGPYVMWSYEGTKHLTLYSKVNDTIGHITSSTSYKLNEWIHIEVKQVFNGREYVHTTSINGKVESSVINGKAVVRPNVKIYASYVYDTPVNGYIRNLVYSHRG